MQWRREGREEDEEEEEEEAMADLASENQKCDSCTNYGLCSSNPNFYFLTLSTTVILF